MSNCPNCSYLLVLLERRRKYKCAKCGKLWDQKEIDAKEFRERNKKQREKDRLDVKREANRIWAREKRSPEDARDYMRGWRKRNKEKISKQKDEYCEENREALAKKSKEWRGRLSGQQEKEQNEKRQVRRKANIEGTRLQSRINYWRQKQRVLALTQLEFARERALEQQFHPILPTKLLS